MNAQSEENLKELFEKFLGSEQARRAVEDIQEAEQMLREYPGPEPDGALIADIKAEVTERLLRKKTLVFRRMVYKTAAVAAAVILLAVVSVKLFERDSGELVERVITASIIPAAIWESDDIATADADLAMLTAEVEQIERNLMAVRLDENGGDGHIGLVELEMELIEIDSDFWKG